MMDDAAAAQLLEEVRALKTMLSAAPPPLALTKMEAARLLSMSKRQLDRLIARGEIATCSGDSRKIPRRAVEEYAKPALAVLKGGKTKRRRKRVPAFDAEAEAAALRARR